MSEVKIPEGYKQTEVGVIPKDWEIKPLAAVVKENRISSGLYKDKNSYGSGTSIIKLGDVFSNDIFNPNSVQKVEADEAEIQRYKIKVGDLIIALASVKLEGVGKVMHVTTLEDETIFDHNVALIRTTESINSYFLSYTFKSNYIRSMIASKATQVGTTFLKSSTILQFNIILPTYEEQTAIANALSDIDDLIESLEKLIAKKEAIKTATMQQLLTGKTRLPEFATHDDGSAKGFKQTEFGWIPEDWEVRKLNQISDVKSGGTPSTSDSSYWNGSILWCTPTDITALKSQKYLSNTLKKITKAGLENSSAELLPIGSIVMTSRATIGECAITTKNISTNQGFKNFICFDNTNNEFLYYNLSNSKNRLVQLCSGSTFLEISTTQTRNFEIAVPSIQEQTAIATILSDLDTEIQALQQRLDKTRDIKQGMMQQLLTGKVRLVD